MNHVVELTRSFIAFVQLLLYSCKNSRLSLKSHVIQKIDAAERSAGRTRKIEFKRRYSGENRGGSNGLTAADFPPLKSVFIIFHYRCAPRTKSHACCDHLSMDHDGLFRLDYENTPVCDVVFPCKPI